MCECAFLCVSVYGCVIVCVHACVRAYVCVGMCACQASGCLGYKVVRLLVQFLSFSLKDFDIIYECVHYF